MHHVYISLGLAAGAIILAVLGYLKSKQAGLYDLYVEATQPSQLAAGVPSYYGGTVVALTGQPTLLAPYSNQPCVYYRYKVETEVQDRDGNGRRTTHWQTVSDEPPQSVLFGLQTAAGTVLVQPADAAVNGAQSYNAPITAAALNGQPSESQPGLLGAVSKVTTTLNNLSTKPTRVSETYIALGQQLYAGGTVVEQNQAKTFTNDQSYPLVLSTKSKSDLVKSERRTGWLEYSGATILGIAASVVFLKIKG